MGYGQNATSCVPLIPLLIPTTLDNLILLFFILSLSVLFALLTDYIIDNINTMGYGTHKFTIISLVVNGCGMGPQLVLVFPCFRENVVVTYKIVSFLCSLDNLLQKNVIVFFFWKSNFKMALIWKRTNFDLLFTFFSYQGKATKIPSAHISLTYIHVFCSPYWLFLCVTNLKKKKNSRYFSLVWFLVLILIRAILKQSINNKMVSKI